LPYENLKEFYLIAEPRCQLSAFLKIFGFNFDL